jgi:DNA invertase Pin-like site-specific DNA recombinase
MKMEMTEHQRVQALSMLLTFAEDGVLPYGCISKIAEKIGVTRSTLSKLWNKAGRARASGHVSPQDVFSRKKMHSGRKPIY